MRRASRRCRRGHRCLALFRAVVARSARLVAHWQAVGFTHGTLNTDNISMLGDTLDYGPFGFMEHFDPQFVPNTSDPSGRYSFAAQPAVMQWNRACACQHGRRSPAGARVDGAWLLDAEPPDLEPPSRVAPLPSRSPSHH